jgi:hypothetical protein
MATYLHLAADRDEAVAALDVRVRHHKRLLGRGPMQVLQAGRHLHEDAALLVQRQVDCGVVQYVAQGAVHTLLDDGVAAEARTHRAGSRKRRRGDTVVVAETSE